LKKPSFKAVAKGEVKANVPGWVLHQGGDPAKRTLSSEAQTLPKSRLISLQVNGVYHSIDVLRLLPRGVEAVQFLQQEIRGLEMPHSMGNELNSFTIPKYTIPVKGKALVAKSDLRPSNQAAPQENALIIRVVEGPTLKFEIITNYLDNN
jgi:hypothetical protein